MIIDKAQKGNILEVSYTNELGEVELERFDIFKTNGIGPYDYVICDEADPDKESVLRHYKDNLPIKKQSAMRFDYEEMREFLLKEIPEEKRKKIFSHTPPNLYMCDIEINTGEGDVFPNPQKAEFIIDSIQITAPNLNTIVLTCNPRALQDSVQIAEVEDAINEHYKDIHFVWTKTKRLKYSHITFKDETEMLIYWWKLVLQKLHAVSFHYGDGFDVPYLWNRCAFLGIDIGMGSPTGEVSNYNFWPKHRYVFDYMKLIVDSAFDIDRTSFSLEHCASEIVGIGKIAKETYKELYQGPIVKFLTYGAVDTISMQLIHGIKNYTAVLEALAIYCNASLFEVTKQTQMVHALIWDELYKNNMINAQPFNRTEQVKYGGGYVKEPTRKFVMWVALEDFSALYPRIMQSFNISFENIVGKVRTKEERDEWTKKGYIVSVNGTIYKNDKDYTLRVIETELLEGRYAYKGLQQRVFLDAMPPLDAEFKRRGIKK